jgi:uncharacterized protein GlcG (DUF336 family)
MPATMQKQTITNEDAMALIAAPEAKAREIGVPMGTAIVDSEGNLKAFSRQDGAALLSVQIAQDKGYTAIAFGMATHEWYEFIKNDPPLLDGIVHTPRLIVFGGGIRVSGGHYSQDQECAEAALASSEKL